MRIFIIALLALATVRSEASMLLQINGRVESITAKDLIIRTGDSLITIKKSALDRNKLEELSKPRAVARLYVEPAAIESVRAATNKSN